MNLLEQFQVYGGNFNLYYIPMSEEPGSLLTLNRTIFPLIHPFNITTLWVLTLLTALCLGPCIGYAQNGCSAMGQTPSTAFPICGTSAFSQSSVPLCPGINVPNSCNYVIPDTNPFYYVFTCFQSGTLGFLITPNNLGDDYDWSLFDISGQSSPNNIYTDASLIVAYDWSGTVGLTGASTKGTQLRECESTDVNGAISYVNPFSSMPNLQKGHKYLLLISHYTYSQSGYSLSFNANPSIPNYGSDVGTALITDTTQPRLVSATPANCGTATVKVALDKSMLCSSLTADGSDFKLLPSGPAIIAASGDYCNSGFDMDTVTLTFAGPIPPGNYHILAQDGTDGNTLVDVCSNEMPVGYSVPLIVPVPPPPPPFDSLEPVGCAPSALTVVIPQGVQCNAVASDGSDFQLTGPGGITITGAGCVPDSSTKIRIQLSSPIDQAGAYRLTLVNGTDGNSLIDSCYQALTVGQTINFSTADTVSAQINDQVGLGCHQDTIDWSSAGGNGINQWTWTFGIAQGSTGTGGPTTQTASGENQQMTYTQSGTETAALVVSNGTCSATATATVTLPSFIKAVFEATNLLCPKDQASFSDSSTGPITSYNWIFGDGTTSSLEYPPAKSYPDLPQDKNYTVQLIVSDGPGCYDTAAQIIQVIANCYIAVPSAFTPNGDGINDYLYPLNAYKAVNLEFRVYDRYGQIVFQTTNWTIRWDGNVNGKPQPVGTYVWTLRYTNSDTGEKVSQKGTTVLMR
jgi:gliding motility-associated-like protein